MHVNMYTIFQNELSHIKTLTALLTTGSRYTKVIIPCFYEFSVVWVVSEWAAWHDA